MTLDRLARLIFALLVALRFAARAETDEVPPLPERKPAHVEGPVLPGDQPTIPWTNEEVAAAKSECDRALKGIALDYEALQPIKDGICGAPAPILVKSIGSDPKVAINPPATMTCALAAGLASWLKDKVQPEAKAKLGTQVVKLANASSYVCRNRYGGATTPLSEHALADALDVSDFVLASGERITVLDSWPKVVTAAADAPKPSQVAVVASSIVKASQAAMPTSLPVAAREGAILIRIKANPFVMPPPQVAKLPAPKPAATTVPDAETTAAKVKSNPFVAPAPAQSATGEPSTPQPPPLPGAKPAEATPQGETAGPTLAERESVFIKDIHDEACDVFGTTLGPAANEAHKNHFHLDMKARRHAGLCD